MGQRNCYWCNFDMAGKDLKHSGEFVHDARFRVDMQTDAGLSFIRRNKSQPFFLYLAYYAPHVPLEAPDKCLDRFPVAMPERRRTGLAMINAVDEGVGRTMKSLRDQGIADNTLIMFTSDNGAPLGAQQEQVMANILPVDKPGPAWDGSRNDPLTGEKGVLAIKDDQGRRPRGSEYLDVSSFSCLPIGPTGQCSKPSTHEHSHHPVPSDDTSVTLPGTRQSETLNGVRGTPR